LNVPLSVGNSIVGLWFVLLFLFIVGGAFGTGTAAGYAPARQGVSEVSSQSAPPLSSVARFRVNLVVGISEGRGVRKCVALGVAEAGNIPERCQLRVQPGPGSQSEEGKVQVVKASTGRKKPPGIQAGEKGGLTLEGVPWHEEGLFGSKTFGVNRYWHLHRGDYLVSP